MDEKSSNIDLLKTELKQQVIQPLIEEEKLGLSLNNLNLITKKLRTNYYKDVIGLQACHNKVLERIKHLDTKLISSTSSNIILLVERLSLEQSMLCPKNLTTIEKKLKRVLDLIQRAQMEEAKRQLLELVINNHFYSESKLFKALGLAASTGLNAKEMRSKMVSDVLKLTRVFQFENKVMHSNMLYEYKLNESHAFDAFKHLQNGQIESVINEIENKFQNLLILNDTHPYAKVLQTKLKRELTRILIKFEDLERDYLLQIISVETYLNQYEQLIKNLAFIVEQLLVVENSELDDIVFL